MIANRLQHSWIARFNKRKTSYVQISRLILLLCFVSFSYYCSGVCLFVCFILSMSRWFHLKRCSPSFFPVFPLVRFFLFALLLFHCYSKSAHGYVQRTYKMLCRKYSVYTLNANINSTKHSKAAQEWEKKNCWKRSVNYKGTTQQQQ